MGGRPKRFVESALLEGLEQRGVVGGGVGGLGWWGGFRVGGWGVVGGGGGGGVGGGGGGWGGLRGGWGGGGGGGGAVGGGGCGGAHSSKVGSCEPHRCRPGNVGETLRGILFSRTCPRKAAAESVLLIPWQKGTLDFPAVLIHDLSKVPAQIPGAERHHTQQLTIAWAIAGLPNDNLFCHRPLIWGSCWPSLESLDGLDGKQATKRIKSRRKRAERSSTDLDSFFDVVVA